MSLNVGLFSRLVKGLLPDNTSKFGHFEKENFDDMVVDRDDDANVEDPSRKNESMLLPLIDIVLISSS
jgi:hypothetical protein